MRARLEILLALVLLLFLTVFVVATRERGPAQEDRRASTFLAGPAGARGLADALAALGVRVERYRRRASMLVTQAPDSGVFVSLNPPYGIDPLEARIYAQRGAEGWDFLLAGAGTDDLMACYGYSVDRRTGDSIPVTPPGRRPDSRTPRVGNAVLASLTDSPEGDTTGAAIEDTGCRFSEVLRVDTLLVTPGGRVAAARLTTEHNHVILLADAALLTNRTVRYTAAGEFGLQVLLPYRKVLFDEYHQGFGGGGSLGGSVISWSLRDPRGWVIWQLAAIGVLALLAAAVRFGPVVRLEEHRRRSPLEHVAALATALAAASGADVAVRLMVQGLRRRLAPGTALRSDPRPWLADLEANVRTERSRRAVRTLRGLTRGAPDADGVLRAANAVEDVWQDLSPSRTTK
ncbi:MAG: hypothetical protein AB7I33_09055 [Gemmatimonadales bacterium]